MSARAFGPPSLIVSDVDGTLIDDDGTVRPLTRRMLATAADRGVPFVLATGRPPRWVDEIARQIPHATYAVCANGAIVYDIVHDSVLHASTLSTSALADLAEAARRELPGCGLAAERVGDPGDDAASPTFVADPGYEHAWLNPDHIEVGDDEVIAAPAVKLLIRSSSMRSGDMADRMRAAVGDRAAITFSTDNGLIELALPGIDKASGLRILADIASLPTDAVVAFGDMPNDVEMLRWATRGVAMANAHPQARHAADEVTTGSNDEGVGRVLARWFL